MADKQQHGREIGRADFHARVFARWGNRCYFCGDFATDAMHIYGRGSRLGKHRFACPEENGRPGCRGCHDTKGRYTSGFALVDRELAAAALNRVLKIQLVA